MKSRHILTSSIAVFTVALAAFSAGAEGATIQKEDNALDLNLDASWLAGVPGVNDIALWDGTVTAANTVLLGADLSWSGMKIENPAGLVTIGAGNTLTLGNSGIDLSAASQDLTISSNLAIGLGGQVWKIAEGRTLTLNTGAFTRLPGATVNVPGSGTIAASMTGLANDGSSGGGILGPWMTVGSSASTRYATLSEGNIVGYTGATQAAAFGWASGNPATENYEVAAVQGALGVSRAANTVRYTGAEGTQTYGNAAGQITLTLNGLMNAGTGTLTIARGGTHLGSGLQVGANRDLVLTAASAPITISATISDNPAGASSVTIAGPEVVTLMGGNTYTGGTYVSSGRLFANSTSLNGGAVHIASGATLTFTGNNQVSTSAVSGAGTILNDSANTIIFNGDHSGFTGTFTHSAGGNNTQFNTAVSGSQNAAYNLTAGELIFAGVGDYTVKMGSFASTGGTIRGGNAASGTVTMETGHLGTSTSIAGNLNNGGLKLIALTKVGDGTLTLTGTNTYTGATTISGGTLRVGDGFIDGSIAGSSSITNNAALVFNVSGSQAYAGPISGAGTLAKNGAGTLALSGASTYGGATNVNEGSLALANASGSATGTGAVNVSAGAALTGTGISSGLTTIAGGATIVPGSSGIGTLTLGALTLNAGSFLDYEIANPGARDFIAVTGAGGLTIHGGAFRLYQPGTNAAFATNGVYNLLSYSGAVGGTGTSALSVDASTMDPNKAYLFGTAGGFVTLTIASMDATPNFWNVDASGNWTSGANWTLGSAPDGPGAMALFGGGGTTITAPRVVTLDADQMVGSLGFNSAQSFTVTGASTLTLNSGADPAAQITNSQGSHTIGVALQAAASTTQFTVLGAADTLTVSGAISGTTDVVKNGDGTLLLSGENSYAGNTTIAGGTVLLAGVGSLGGPANPLQVTGGALDLGGTSQLTDAVTISGGAISNGTLVPVSFTANGAGTSTVTANIAGSAEVTNDGPGTLVLGGNNSYTGNTVVNGGMLAISSLNALGDAGNMLIFNGGGLRVDGTTVTNFGARTVMGFPAALNVADVANTFTIAEGVSTSVALVKQGAGTLVLAGTNQFSQFETSSIQGGRVVFDGGSFTGASVVSNVGLEIAPLTGTIAAMTVQNGATIETNRLVVGGNIANNAGGSATLDILGGTINSRQWFSVGSAGTGTSTVNMSGGTLNVNAAFGTQLEVGVFGAASGVFNIGGDSQVNVFNNGNIAVGVINNGTGNGTITQSGTGTVTFYSDPGFTVGGTGALRLGSGTGRTGAYTYNLDGGTLSVGGIVRSSGTSVFNFNGGLLKATASNGAYMTNTIAGVVKAGGARIDTNGFDITIPAVLAHEAALGATADGGVTKSGGGTLTLSGANSYTGNVVVNAGTLVANSGVIGNPITSALGNNTIAGRTITVGANAALSLTVNDVFGNQAAVAGNLPALIVNGGTLHTTRYNQLGALTLNGAQLTSSNTTDQGNYQNFQFLGEVTVGGLVPSFIGASGAANFDGNHLAGATQFTVADVTGNGDPDLLVSAPLRNQSGNYGNGAGGLVKAGPGTMLLTGASTYTGTTTVNAGALITSTAQTGATTVTVTDGATFGVKLSAAGTTFNTATLNTGATTGAKLVFDTGTFGNPTAPMLFATAFNPLAATVLEVTGAALAVGNNIPLLDYSGTIGGTTFAGLSLILPPRTLGGLVDNAADTRVDFNITQFEQIKWTGSMSNTWDADTDGTGANGTQNWVTTASAAPTKYLQGTGGTDTAKFDDTASGSTDIELAMAISPQGAFFDNSVLNYSISSAAGFGIGGTGPLVKRGAATLALNTANTYSGGTTLHQGRMILNHVSALGTGMLTINGGSLDTTTPVVLSTNNAQEWNGDFGFAGSSDLDMGTGAVTVGGAGTDRVVAVAAGTFAVGEVRSAAHGLTKEGAGTLVLTSTGATGAGDGSRVAGVVNVAAGSLQINRSGTVAAASGDLLTGGVAGSGTIVNGAAVERWVVSNSVEARDFSGTLANGGAGALGFNKQGGGAQILSGANSYTGLTTLDAGTLVISGANTGPGTNANVNGGNLVLANPSALGGTSLIRLAGNNVSTLTLAHDGGGAIYNLTQGTTTHSSIVADRATPGPGIDHNLTTQIGANGVGGGSITFTSGANVTSGASRVSFPYFGLGAGSVQTTLLNPSTANVTIGDLSKANNNISQTIELGGTTQDNHVTGSISNGVLTGANTLSLVKSGTSKWTLSGFSFYTGPTTVNGGTLVVQGSISGSSVVNVNAGTLGGAGSIGSVINVGDGIGTADALMAPGAGIGTLTAGMDVNFQADAVFALEIDSDSLAADLLSSSGMISLGLGVARLSATDLGSTVLALGESFTILSSASGITGEFFGLPDGGVFGAGANFFEIDYHPTTVEIIAVPEPAAATLLLMGLGSMLGLRRARQARPGGAA